MPSKPMNRGVQAPPVAIIPLNGDIFRQQFKNTMQPNPGGVKTFAYLTFGAMAQALVGAGTGLARQGVLVGQKPFVALPTIGNLGNAYVPGQIVSTPLSANPNDATINGA